MNRFQWAAKTLTDRAVRVWARTNLPLLQEDLRMAKDMEAAVKNEK